MIPDYNETLRKMDKILEDEMTPKDLAGPYELGGHNPPPFYKSLIQDYNEMRAYVVDLETRLARIEPTGYTLGMEHAKYVEMRASVVELEARISRIIEDEMAFTNKLQQRIAFLESRPVYLPPPLELDIAGYPKKQQAYPGYPTWQYVTTVTPPPTK